MRLLCHTIFSYNFFISLVIFMFVPHDLYIFPHLWSSCLLCMIYTFFHTCLPYAPNLYDIQNVPKSIFIYKMCKRLYSYTWSRVYKMWPSYTIQGIYKMWSIENWLIHIHFEGSFIWSTYTKLSNSYKLWGNYNKSTYTKLSWWLWNQKSQNPSSPFRHVCPKELNVLICKQLLSTL